MSLLNLWKYEEKKIELVRLHLLTNGIGLTYHKLIWYGERYAHSEDDFDQFGDGGKNYICDDLIDMVHAAYDETDNPKEFIKLLEDVEKLLYPGCVKFTKLSVIVKLYNLKTIYGWSDNNINSLFTLMKYMLPDSNKLHSSLYDANKSLVALGIDYEKIHAYPNDYVLYWKEYDASTSYSTCGASRWKICRNSTIKNLFPAKDLWFFQPIPRFQRMFRNKKVSKDLNWHAEERASDGYLRHPADSPYWKVVDHKWPEWGCWADQDKLPQG